nr:tRNA lysidine(34) synthetase TilS [uncultured Mediterraneibacter sp.]
MMKKIEKRVEQFIEKQNMIQPGDRIVTGVSGGADSICLLVILCRLRERLGFEVEVCHVNHCLRGADADADEAYVKQICGQLQVPCHIFRKNVELIAKNGKQSLEEAGRMVRHRAFEEICEKNRCTKIATAHHQQDNAETILMNLARGTGLKGICGIRPVYGERIRPLLCLTREEIELYLEKEKIHFCTDETNAEDEYTRNRIRHHVLPVLEQEVNRRTVRHLNELGEQAEEVMEYLEKQTDKAWAVCTELRESGAVFLREDRISELSKVIKKLLVRRAICTVAGSEKDIELVHVQMLLSLFERQVGRSANLPYRIKAERIYEGILMKKEAEQRDISRDKKSWNSTENSRKKETEQVTELRIPGEICLEKTGQRIVCEICPVEDVTNAKEMPQKSYTKCFDYDIIRSSLCARYRRPGDYLTIDSRGGRKKLKSYFIDEKIPREEREKLLLIAEGNHIVWIPGRRMSSHYQIGDKTKTILKIKIMEE